jgi:hypothetical protein
VEMLLCNKKILLSLLNIRCLLEVGTLEFLFALFIETSLMIDEWLLLETLSFHASIIGLELLLHWGV